MQMMLYRIFHGDIMRNYGDCVDFIASKVYEDICTPTRISQEVMDIFLGLTTGAIQTGYTSDGSFRNVLESLAESGDLY